MMSKPIDIPQRSGRGLYAQPRRITEEVVERTLNCNDLVIYSSELSFVRFGNRWKSSNDLVSCELLMTSMFDRDVLRVNKSTLRRLKTVGLELDYVTRLLHHLRNGSLTQLEIKNFGVKRTSVFDRENVFPSLTVLSISSVKIRESEEEAVEAVEAGEPVKPVEPVYAFNAPKLTTVYLGE